MEVFLNTFSKSIHQFTKYQLINHSLNFQTFQEQYNLVSHNKYFASLMENAHLIQNHIVLLSQLQVTSFMA